MSSAFSVKQVGGVFAVFGPGLTLSMQSRADADAAARALNEQRRQLRIVHDPERGCGRCPFVSLEDEDGYPHAHHGPTGPAAPRPTAPAAAPAPAPPPSACAALPAGAGSVAGWWVGHRDHQIAVTGADLVAEGVTPGPAIGRALAEVRAAMLDGRVAGREQQLALALGVARGERP